MTQQSSYQKEKPSHNTMRFARLLLMALGSFLFIAASLLLTGNANASVEQQAGMTPTIVPSPTPTFDPMRLARPNVPAPALQSQVQKGALIYWGICMACHGDRGQGLTDEWRFGAYGEDANCWHSGCHAKNHPPQGFELPKIQFPALSSASALGRFDNAQQLYDYVVVMMPWWKPNSLGSEKAWQVVAYVLKLRGSLPEGLVLNDTNASAVPVHRLVTYPQNDNTGILLFIGTFLLIMFGLIVRDIFVGQTNASSADLTVARGPRPNFFAHLHPPTIPAMQARWRYTLGAGGMAVFLSLLLVVTGLLEMFYYVPTPEKAAITIETITTLVPFGAFVRNIHYWSAQLLVIVALFHLARVIFTGAYGAPRRFNFLLGVVLLAFVILLDFTGYILRWDEGIRWALTAGTNLLKSIPVIGNSFYVFVTGGSEPGPATLLRFYSWHIFALAVTGAIIMIWHLFRVRRDGGIAVAPAAQREDSSRITRFELLRREIFGMLAGGIIVAILAAFVPAPIATPIRGGTILSAESSAPWFFLWVQQLLKLGNPFLLGVLLPLGILIFLAAMPYLFKRIDQSELGSWFPRSGRVVQLIFVILATLIIVLTLFSVLKIL